MRRHATWLLALGIAVALATLASPFASSSPDGLERVATDHGFAVAASATPVEQASPLAGYAAPGLGDARLATAAAGLAGTLLVAALGLAVVRVARRRASTERGARP